MRMIKYVALLTLFVFGTLASASVICSVSGVYSGTDTIEGEVGTLDFGVWYSINRYYTTPIPETLIDWQDIDVTDVGKVYFRNEFNDPQYGIFRNMLINNTNDQIRFGCGDVVKQYDENSIFDYGTRQDFDLMHGLSLTIDSYDRVSDDTYEVVYTFSFLDIVPEPASASLLAVAAMALIRRRGR